MRLGIRPFALHRGDPLAQVALAARLGAACVQLDTPPAGEASAVGDAARSAGIAIGSFCAMPVAILHDGAPGAAAVADISRALEIADAAGVRVVTVFAGEHPELAERELLQRFADRFGPLAAYAERLGVAIAIENCPLWSGDRRRIGNLAYSPARWRRMFAAVPSSAIGLDLDTGHFPALGIDPAVAIRAAGARIRHVQLKDAVIDRAALAEEGCIGGLPHSYRLPGDGDIDFAAVLAALRDVGYQGCAVVDVHTATEKDHAYALAFLRRIAAQRSEATSMASP